MPSLTKSYTESTGQKSNAWQALQVLGDIVAEEKSTGEKTGLTLQKILLFTLVGINIVTMIGGAASIYLWKIADKTPTITEEKEKAELAEDRELRMDKPVLFTFEPFTINLDGRPRKLVRTTIQLEMLSEEGYEEAVDLTPVERDQIVRILNEKKYEDIETIQGKLFLKDQIMTAMNGLLKKGMVKEVYFNEFLVQ